MPRIQWIAIYVYKSNGYNICLQYNTLQYIPEYMHYVLKKLNDFICLEYNRFCNTCLDTMDYNTYLEKKTDGNICLEYKKLQL